MNDNGYRFHVFVSYKRAREENGRLRDTAVETWVKMFFEDELQNKLTDALRRGESARIFLDQFDIRSGEQWKQSIAQALCCSACLVPVWSTLYFTSPWCVSEWASFSIAGRPVVPVRWDSQLKAPAGAGGTQGTDFSAFKYTVEAFRQSVKYLDFQDQVTAFANDVAAAVLNAPDFDAGRQVVLPEPPTEPRPPNVLLLEELDNKDRFLSAHPSRVSRGDLVLAA